MKSKISKFFCVALAAALLGINVSAVSDTSFTIVDGKHINTPLCYSCTQTIGYLGAEGGSFSDALDLFIDSADNIYITDTNNNRIIKLDPDGNYIETFGKSAGLNAPQSTFVAKNGDLFVADTGNKRIVHLSSSDEVVETFKKPDSELISESVDFSVNKLAISEQGIIYVVQAQQFMMIDSDNEFRGYVGANKVGFNIKEFFIRTFGSTVQVIISFLRAVTARKLWRINPQILRTLFLPIFVLIKTVLFMPSKKTAAEYMFILLTAICW